MGTAESSRHHYIPTFYQAHFCNQDGRLFRYDKVTNTISQRWWYPKQVFFEWDKNNVRMGDTIPESLPETIYRQQDSLFAERLNALATGAVNQSLLTQDRILGVLGFVASLWTRSPSRDRQFALYALRRLEYALSDNPAIAKDPQRIIGIMDGIQVERAFLSSGHFLRYFQSGKAFEYPAYSHVGQMDIPFIVLSDRPVIYRNKPNSNEDIFRNFVLPLSSRRLYWSMDETNTWTGSTKTHAVAYNILAIEQATRYVAAWNHEFLRDAIDIWKRSCGTDILKELRSELFSFPPHFILEDHLSSSQG